MHLFPTQYFFSLFFSPLIKAKQCFVLEFEGKEGGGLGSSLNEYFWRRNTFFPREPTVGSRDIPLKIMES